MHQQGQFLLVVSAGKCFYLTGLPPRMGLNLSKSQKKNPLPSTWTFKKQPFRPQSQMSSSTAAYLIHLLASFSTFGLSNWAGISHGCAAEFGFSPRMLRAPSQTRLVLPNPFLYKLLTMMLLNILHRRHQALFLPSPPPSLTGTRARTPKLLTFATQHTYQTHWRDK